VLDASSAVIAAGHASRAARAEPALALTDVLANVLDALPTPVVGRVFGGLLKHIDVDVSNVPGLTKKAFLGGARLDRLWAFAPPTGAALSVTLLSHLDQACIAVVSDDAAIDDPSLLVRCLRSGFDDVLPLAGRPTRDVSEPRSLRSRATLDLIPSFDASYLELERPGLPMHIGFAAVLDGAPLRDADGQIRLDTLRDRVASRLGLLPRFRQKAVKVPLRPARWMWVDDPAFDIANHVKLTTVAHPGDEAALLQRCCELQGELLDRSHPLWELWVIDGLAGGNVGLVEKAHHTMIDGVAGVDVTTILMDASPIELGDEPVAAVEAAPAPGALDAVVDLTREVVEDTRQVVDLTVHPTHAWRRITAVSGQRGAMAHFLRTAPRTSLNQPVGDERRLVAVRRPLAAVKAAGRPHDGTVNDVVLAAIAGGLRSLLAARDEPTDHALRALVPVSVRSAAEHSGAGNRTGAVFVDLPCELATTAERLEWLVPRTRALKQSGIADEAEHLLGGVPLPRVVERAVAEVIHHQPFVNLVITNIPGPPQRVYIGGAAMLDAVPVVPLAGNLTMGIAILSYDGVLTIGIDADTRTVPDLDLFVRELELALDEVVEVEAQTS
jgi:WS/DGAT/MGAT family acyltransferase